TRSGAIIAIDPSWSIPSAHPVSEDFRLEIVGSQATLSLDLAKQSTQFYHHLTERTEHLYWGDDATIALIDDFIRLVRGDEHQLLPVYMTGQDSIRTLKMAQCAYQSMEADGTPQR